MPPNGSGAKVMTLMHKRNRGERIISSAREMQRALLDADIEVSRATVTEDMLAVGARYLDRPTTADPSDRHIAVRKESAKSLFAADPQDDHLYRYQQLIVQMSL